MAALDRAVLDTSVLIATDVPALAGELAISAASLAELHFGVLATDDAQVRAARLQRLALIEHLFTPLSADDAVARSYGHLAATIARSGRPSPTRRAEGSRAEETPRAPSRSGRYRSVPDRGLVDRARGLAGPENFSGERLSGPPDRALVPPKLPA